MSTQKSEKVNYSIQLTDVGPHTNTQFSARDVSGVNAVIYAANGSGKSFISKAFKRISDVAYLDGNNEEDKSLLIEKNNGMISFGKSEGEVHFKISGANSAVTTLDIKFEKDNLPVIDNRTPLIFHVFNSEYVKENLEAVGYKPEDKVSGFILGKSSIDLSKEKSKLSSLNVQREHILAEIDKIINDSLYELRMLSVHTYTTEYKHIILSSILEKNKIDMAENFDEIKAKYDVLKSMPEDIEDIPFMLQIRDAKTEQVLDSIKDVLRTPYTLSSFSEAFKAKIKSNNEFIMQGLALNDGRICPFCEQEYSKAASDLIDQYTEFSKDLEASVISQLTKHIHSIDEIMGEIEYGFDVEFLQVESEFNKIKRYFPSFADHELNAVDARELLLSLEKIGECLKGKIEDISKAYDIEENIKEVKENSKRINAEISENNKWIQRLNRNKNSTKSERLLLRKALCKAMKNRIIDTATQKIDFLEQMDVEIKALAQDIEEKESTVQKSKRDALIQELKRHLRFFFEDKYDFDEENFCVSYKKRNLIDNADQVLSDGEKSILAFCFYLSNIHAIVKNTNDYEKLFFIIDDPVSSMDFNYVYNVAQSIKNLKNLESLKRFRMIILTHNMEFMSILVRNKVVANKYIYENGIFNDCKDEYILPYNAHLIDLLKVADKKVPPSHTTANSFRHVLETIYRFEGATDDFVIYVKQIPELRDNAFIYALMQDMSHGGIRSMPGYTDEMLISACGDLIQFIRRKYEGQIVSIEKITN